MMPKLTMELRPSLASSLRQTYFVTAIELGGDAVVAVCEVLLSNPVLVTIENALIVFAL
jgi:hypothetical protein